MNLTAAEKSDSDSVVRDASGEGANREIEPLALYVLLGAFVILVLRTAWLSDDSFISLRTLDNFVHGAGLRYNLLERVQAYTHPLWLALLAPVYALTRAPFVSAIGVSVVCSAIAAWLLAFRVARSSWHALLALALLAFSSTFVDYSTSGLENPLTHLLVVSFVGLFLGRPARGPLSISFLGSLIILNRLDLALLVVPAIVVAAIGKDAARGNGSANQTSPGKSWRQVAVGLVPVGLWELFSMVYYGFPFPNTAYAKLATGIPRSELIEQGLYYLVDVMFRDPLTPLVIAVAVSLAVVRREPRTTALALGIILYLLYVVSIGGDFMSGRFLSAPYCMSVAFLATQSMSRRTIGIVILAALLLAGVRPSQAARVSPSGITDERPFYEALMGLPNLYRGHRIERNHPTWDGVGIGHSAPTVRIQGAIGVLGFAAGPSVHLVDVMGLSDPLLARLPASNRPDWRIGHFERKLPNGYLATLESGQNSIESPNLAAYYERLSLITQGPLFTRQRLAAIWTMNLGGQGHLIDRESAARPYHRTISIGAVSAVKADGSPIDHPSNAAFVPREAVLIRLGRLSSCPSLEIGLFAGERYRLAFYRGDELLPWYENQYQKRTDHGFGMVQGTGVQKRSLAVPPDVTQAGYDGILIRAGGSDPSITPGLGYVVACGNS